MKRKAEGVYCFLSPSLKLYIIIDPATDDLLWSRFTSNNLNLLLLILYTSLVRFMFLCMFQCILLCISFLVQCLVRLTFCSFPKNPNKLCSLANQKCSTKQNSTSTERWNESHLNFH